MNIPAPSMLILVAAGIGLVVNTLAILAVSWRGGRVMGSMTGTMAQLSEEVRLLRATRDDHATAIARAVQQLDDIERRVARLESS